MAASPAAEVTQPAAPSAAPPARRPRLSQAWKRRLGICFGAIGLVLIVWAATVGVRSSGVLSFERAQTSPTTLAGDEADIWAEMDAVKAERDVELQHRFDETTDPGS